MHYEELMLNNLGNKLFNLVHQQQYSRIKLAQVLSHIKARRYLTESFENQNDHQKHNNYHYHTIRPTDDLQSKMTAYQQSINQPDIGLLPQEEAKALESFTDIVNNVLRGNISSQPISKQTALKFLMSSKFDVDRALETYRSHEVTRHREGLTELDPQDENLKFELESGKFTILDKRGPENSAIAIFTAKLHAPNKQVIKNYETKRKIHQYTLQGIVYQLDAALENIETQRNGIIFIYDMSDSEYAQFDYELCQKILNLLKGAYPAKLKKVLIVSPPLWFRAPFHLLRLIVREKLRERVWLIKLDQLPEHIPLDVLPYDLGGTHNHNHQTWLIKCSQTHNDKHNDLCDPLVAKHIAGNFSHSSSLRRLSQDRMIQQQNQILIPTSPNHLQSHHQNPPDNNHNHIERIITNHQFNPAAPYHQAISAADYFGSITNQYQPTECAIEALATEFDYDDNSGVCLMNLAEKFKTKGKSGLNQEYDELKSKFRPGSTRIAELYHNRVKNRWINILPYDHTRVILKPDDVPLSASELAAITPEMESQFDYINACYIDGYRQRRAYISTQGPLDSTCMDFWRMIWQTQSRVIAMFALVRENGMPKCHQYWPTSPHYPVIEGLYHVAFKSVDMYQDFTVTELRLVNTKLDEARTIWHLQYTSWPDFGTPNSAAAILKFREFALKKQLDAIDQCGPQHYPPFVVHCSAGVGRTGTFITIDISIQKLETTGLVDIYSVVDKLRYQRTQSVQTGEQYVFCYRAVLEYAVSCGLLEQSDLSEVQN